jgi:hypothetical protein
MPIDDELHALEIKLKQLKLDYDQYFLGSRPREPSQLRSEVQKLFTVYQNVAIPNTAARFRFNSLCARFFALRRQWDETLRKIEEGTYARHLFKADLHSRERSKPRAAAAAAGAGTGGAAASPGGDIFDAYRDACASCGQELGAMTRDRLAGVLRRQEEELRKRFGCQEVRFRVTVEDGKVRLKATPVGAGNRAGA